MSKVRGRRKARAPKISEKLTEQEQASRKSLSILQPAADNPNSLVGSHGTSTYRKLGELKTTLDSKENSPMKLRRSKRKAAVTNPEKSKVVKSSTPITNETKDTGNSNLKQQTLTKYSKKLIAKLKEADISDQEEEHKKITEKHPEASTSGISIQTESSGYCSDGTEKLEDGLKPGSSDENKPATDVIDTAYPSQDDDCVVANEKLQSTASIPQDVHDLLLSDKVPVSHLTELAEQYRLALEEALHENELLSDQREVLEAEYSGQDPLVKEAEKLYEIVNEQVFGKSVSSLQPAADSPDFLVGSLGTSTDQKEQVFGKSHSILQPAADNPDSLVGPVGTSTDEKVRKLKAILEEKSPIRLRRSKRKAALLSSEESKFKSSTPIANDTKNKENSNLRQQTLTKYSKKLIAKIKEPYIVDQEEKYKKIAEQHPEARASGISIQSESSGYCSDGTEKHGSGLMPSSSAENKSATDVVGSTYSSQKDDCVAANEQLQSTVSIPQDVYDLLCGEKVPDSYWTELIEQRRLAVEETHHENELIRDEMEVLEAAIARRNKLVNDGKKLAEIVNDILDE